MKLYKVFYHMSGNFCENAVQILKAENEINAVDILKNRFIDSETDGKTEYDLSLKSDFVEVDGNSIDTIVAVPMNGHRTFAIVNDTTGLMMFATLTDSDDYNAYFWTNEMPVNYKVYDLEKNEWLLTECTNCYDGTWFGDYHTEVVKFSTLGNWEEVEEKVKKILG